MQTRLAQTRSRRKRLEIHFALLGALPDLVGKVPVHGFVELGHLR